MYPDQAPQIDVRRVDYLGASGAISLLRSLKYQEPIVYADTGTNTSEANKRYTRNTSIDAGVKFIESGGQIGDWKATLWLLEGVQTFSKSLAKANISLGRNPFLEDQPQQESRDGLTSVTNQVKGEHGSARDKLSYLKYKFTKVLSRQDPLG